ncbi:MULTISPECIES: DUF2971 domain-containing protein [Shewanella]|uniref:DUF2971 domain-containing protein n=1 Tax=Shewanella TaxID=22 RepID=UPI000CF6F682|nr:DUF2971 domain-containing protein [Shewanella sp. WE21]AVI67577.1 hypothetical protein CKQ84_17870 [Shewanella sp. WE21]
MTLDELEKKCVFRYRTMNKNTMNEVLNEEIWHSTIDGLNDPFEFPITLDWSNLKDCDNGVLVKYALHFKILPTNEMTAYFLDGMSDKVREIVVLNLDKLKSSLPEYYGGLFVACFSKNMRSPLMWSHYSDGMKGVCIAYDRSRLEESEQYDLHPVQYNETPLKLDYTHLHMVDAVDEFKYFDFVNNEHSLAKGFLVRLLSYDYLYQKHKRWSYEYELRNIIDPNNSRSNPKFGHAISRPKGAISAIIIGSKMKKIHINMVNKYCDFHDIPIYVASPKFDDYSVKIKLYNKSIHGISPLRGAAYD